MGFKIPIKSLSTGKKYERSSLLPPYTYPQILIALMVL